MAKRPIRVSESKSRVFTKGEIVKDEDFQEFMYAGNGCWWEPQANPERYLITHTTQVEQKVKYYD